MTNADATYVQTSEALTLPQLWARSSSAKLSATAIRSRLKYGRTSQISASSCCRRPQRCRSAPARAFQTADRDQPQHCGRIERAPLSGRAGPGRERCRGGLFQHPEQQLQDGANAVVVDKRSMSRSIPLFITAPGRAYSTGEKFSFSISDVQGFRAKVQIPERHRSGSYFRTY